MEDILSAHCSRHLPSLEKFLISFPKPQHSSTPFTSIYSCSFITKMHALLFYLGLATFRPVLVACQLWCNTTSSHIMVQDAVAEQAQYGSTSELISGYRQPWPLMQYRGVHLRVVKYCYRDQQTRDKFHCDRILPALSSWGESLGGAPSAQSGHGLGFLEANDGHQDPSQRRPEFCLGSDGRWNPRVGPGTLSVFRTEGDPLMSSATVGYKALGSRPGRHRLDIGEQASVGDVVHEVNTTVKDLSILRRS